MMERTLVAGGHSLALVAAILSLAPVAAMAQGSAPQIKVKTSAAGRVWAPAKTADNKPDLQGV